MSAGKRCACGVTHVDWHSLPYVGIQRVGYGEPDLEMRNCTECGSTMAVPVHVYRPTDAAGERGRKYAAWVDGVLATHAGVTIGESETKGFV